MNINGCILKTVWIIFLSLYLLPLNTLAENHSANNDDWNYSVTPYLWITGQKGKVATLPPAEPIELDISFSDVIDNMDISLMGFFEARKGRFGLFSEAFYIGVSTDNGDTPVLFIQKQNMNRIFGVLASGHLMP